jgi:thymidylate kinase
MPEQQEIGQLVTAVFRALQDADIQFLVLRNYEHLPQFTTNDIDVLVHPAQRREAEKVLLAAAHGAGFRLHNRAEFATLALYLCSPQSSLQVHFDLFTTLKWRAFDFLDCRGFLGRRRQRDLFAIPHLADEAATNLLASLIYTGRVKEKYKPSITAGFRAEAAAASELLAKTYGQSHAELLVVAGAQQKWAEIESRTGVLRCALVTRQLLRHPLRTFGTLATDVGRLTRRLLRPPGLTVVLCGADGSGKSTAGCAILEGLSGTFSPAKGRYFHWKPALFSAKRRAERGPAIDPHGQTIRNPAASLFYFAFHWTEFFLGSHLVLRAVAFRGGLVLIDRFYYDFFVDQRRYRLRVPQRLVRLGYVFLKKPDLIVLLDAPAEVLQQRKQEVTLAETHRQCQAYRALVQSLPNGRIIQAIQPPQKVATDINQTILDFMAERTRKRWGMPSIVPSIPANSAEIRL